MPKSICFLHFDEYVCIELCYVSDISFILFRVGPIIKAGHIHEKVRSAAKVNFIVIHIKVTNIHHLLMQIYTPLKILW